MTTPTVSRAFVRRLHGDPWLVLLGRIRALWSRVRHVQDGDRRRVFIGAHELLIRMSPPSENFHDFHQEFGGDIGPYMAGAVQKLIFQ